MNKNQKRAYRCDEVLGLKNGLFLLACEIVNRNDNRHFIAFDSNFQVFADSRKSYLIRNLDYGQWKTENSKRDLKQKSRIFFYRNFGIKR